MPASRCQTVSTCEHTDCSEQGHTCQPLQHAGPTCSSMQTKAQHTPTTHQRLQKAHNHTLKLPLIELKLKATKYQLSKKDILMLYLTSLHDVTNYHASVHCFYSICSSTTVKANRSLAFTCKFVKLHSCPHS